MAVGLKIVNGDIVISNSGTLEVVTQSDKCSRDIYKMLVTDSEFTGNETTFERYNPTYGTELNNKSLYQGLSRSAVRDVVITLLNSALQKYITLQESRDNLDYGEVITGVDYDVFYDVEDMRNLVASIKVYSALGGLLDLGNFVQQVS